MSDSDHLYQSYEITTYSYGKIEQREAHLVREIPLKLVVNGRPAATLACSPQAWTELALGYLISEGILERDSGLRSVQTEGQTIRIETENSEPEYRAQAPMVNTCNSLALKDFSATALLPLTAGKERFHILDLLACSKSLDERSAAFRLTGGVHSAALAYKERLLCRYEDIGRHNAVDKTLGYAYLQNFIMEDKGLVLSGRVAAEILLKAYRHGLPLIVSRSAPTLKAVILARQLNITLVGFARGEQLNIYCGAERIIL